jgi:hypothetical protein
MASSSEERRVVLVKPGDVLLIGNVGDHIANAESWDHVGPFFRDVLGIRVVVFERDIVLDLLPVGASDA